MRALLKAGGLKAGGAVFGQISLRSTRQKLSFSHCIDFLRRILENHPEKRSAKAKRKRDFFIKLGSRTLAQAY